MTNHLAFERLDERLQRQLYVMKWPALRPIQVDTINAFFDSNDHLVLMAETAAGKTEAAFLPILSAIASEPRGSVRTVYVGPLKALINDQFARLEQLCTHLDMPVHRWHGDVSAAHKDELLRDPSGVLLITPESLESLLVNRTSFLPRLFGGLRAIVVDELHAFLDGERGRHLASLIPRIARYRDESSPKTRLLGLSATIGEPQAARRYLARDDVESVQIISDRGGASEIRLLIHGFDAHSLTERQELSGGAGDQDLESFQDEIVVNAICEDLVEHCRSHSNLIFANRKGDIEIYADQANEICRQAGLPEQFLVHHGSLSREVREDTEEQMKASRAKTTICSSTLEMGIDIGSVRMAGQIGAPWSVSSLKQRMGRSGRHEDEPRRLRCYVDVTVNPKAGQPLTRIPIELLQATAVCELMIAGWMEPPREHVLDLSTLTHQIISTIAETGAIDAEGLHRRLCVEGPFRQVSPGIFTQLLRSLAAHDIIEQGPDRALILGLVGEDLRKRRDFYAAFMGQVEYTVVHQNRVLGALPFDALPKPGQFIVFAARRWQVSSVDSAKRAVLVEPSKRRDRPNFIGDPGIVHQHVREQMRRILGETERYRYLDPESQHAIDAAREYALREGIIDHKVIGLGARECLWFTWAGTMETRTYLALLQSNGIDAIDSKVALQCRCSKQQLLDVLAHWRERTPDLAILAEHVVPKEKRKYDEYVSSALLDVGIASELVWQSPQYID